MARKRNAPTPVTQPEAAEQEPVTRPSPVRAPAQPPPSTKADDEDEWDNLDEDDEDEDDEDDSLAGGERPPPPPRLTVQNADPGLQPFLEGLIADPASALVLADW